MATKKEKERKYLEMVRREVVDFPIGKIDDSEGPDFLVHSAHALLGIEVTRIFSYADPGAPTPQSQDAEQDLVVERAQAIAKARGICPLWVDVHFDWRHTIGKRDRDSIAEQLIDLVCGHLPSADEHLNIEKRHPLTVQFPPQVEGVSMWRLKCIKSHLWQAGGGGIVNENFAPRLRQFIEAKNTKVADYRRRCVQCWLVVVADWRGPSAFFEISDQMSDECYQTDFDRAYFVEAHSGRVARLKTATTRA